MGKPIKRVGDTFTLVQVIAINRGGAVVKGQVKQFDLDASDAAVTGGFKLASELNVMGNLVPADTVGIASGFPMAVAMRNMDDDAAGLWTLEGPVDVAMADIDVDANSIIAGDGVTVGNAAAFVDEVTAAERLFGVALEAAGADSTIDDNGRLVDASSHRRRVLWFGGRPGGGWTIAAS